MLVIRFWQWTWWPLELLPSLMGKAERDWSIVYRTQGDANQELKQRVTVLEPPARILSSVRSCIDFHLSLFLNLLIEMALSFQTSCVPWGSGVCFKLFVEARDPCANNPFWWKTRGSGPLHKCPWEGTLLFSRIIPPLYDALSYFSSECTCMWSTIKILGLK